MSINVEQVKQLRELTSAGVLECRKALEETNGDIDKAVEILREKGLAKAAKKAGREAHEGIIGHYVHMGAKVAALVEVNCETDFVARTPEFQEFAHDLAMQVVAANPLFLRPEDIPQDVLECEKEKFRSEIADAGKPPEIVEKIIEGKLQKYYEEVCLFNQPFIKNDDITVGELITQMIAKLGENIIVRRFIRFAVGE